MYALVAEDGLTAAEQEALFEAEPREFHRP
jgi:hypothetical protein